MQKRFIEKDLKIGQDKTEFSVIKEGTAEGVLVRSEIYRFFRI